MFYLGDVVTIEIEHPDGVDDINVRGKTGVIIRKDGCLADGTINYDVKYDSNDAFVFGEEQIRYATNDEILHAFKRMIGA